MNRIVVESINILETIKENSKLKYTAFIVRGKSQDYVSGGELACTGCSLVAGYNICKNTTTIDEQHISEWIEQGVQTYKKITGKQRKMTGVLSWTNKKKIPESTFMYTGTLKASFVARPAHKKSGRGIHTCSGSVPLWRLFDRIPDRGFSVLTMGNISVVFGRYGLDWWWLFDSHNRDINTGQCMEKNKKKGKSLFMFTNQQKYILNHMEALWKYEDNDIPYSCFSFTQEQINLFEF